MARIEIIDDDLAMDVLVDNLRYRGHNARRLSSASGALQALDEAVSADLVVLDVIMPWPTEVSPSQLAGSHLSGMEIYRELRTKNKDLPIIVYSATQDAGVIAALSEDPHTSFLSKWGGCTLGEIVGKIQSKLTIENTGSRPRSSVFIVHGQNDYAKLNLKNYLQNTLGFPEPIILHEQPNMGRTIIEKFEEYALRSTLIFVLLTPDDVVSPVSDPDDNKRRARQNVVFEMGYFLGMLGRQTGRVILLYQGPLELPSDLSGVVYIDVTNGIESAGELIRREVENVE
jgi:CheY-like chemotaxis protein